MTPAAAGGMRQNDTQGARDAGSAVPFQQPRNVSVWAFTEVVTRLRRVLRASIRSDIPWETLPMAQVELLQGLTDQPGQRLRDLAERHRLASNTVSTLIQQMVCAGLVQRCPDPLDRRAVTVQVTARGEDALAQWLEGHEHRFLTALDTMTESDRRSIIHAVPALSRLVRQLELTTPAAAPAEPPAAGDP